MKKQILHSFLFVVCIAAFISCSKEVKAPGKISNNISFKTAPVTTQTTSASGHTCGGGNTVSSSSSNNNNSGY